MWNGGSSSFTLIESSSTSDGVGVNAEKANEEATEEEEEEENEENDGEGIETFTAVVGCNGGAAKGCERMICFEGCHESSPNDNEDSDEKEDEKEEEEEAAADDDETSALAASRYQISEARKKSNPLG